VKVVHHKIAHKNISKTLISNDSHKEIDENEEFERENVENHKGKELYFY